MHHLKFVCSPAPRNAGLFASGRPDELSLSISNCPLVVWVHLLCWWHHLCHTLEPAAVRLSLVENGSKFGGQLTQDLWGNPFWSIHMTDSAQDSGGRQSVGNDPRLVRRHWVALVLRDRGKLRDVRSSRGQGYACEQRGFRSNTNYLLIR